MKLQLSRPLVFLDLETTGTDARESRILEISMLKELPPAIGSKKAILYECLVNPGVPIPEAATNVHGYTNESLKDELTFPLIAKEVHHFISGCDIGGFNSNSFDVPLLYNELKRAGITWNWKGSNFVDVGNIFKIKESRTLSAAYLFYCDEKLEKAHSAGADVQATEKVLLQQLKRYEADEDLKNIRTVADLALFSNYGKEIVDITGVFTKNEKGDIVFNIGKHKGKLAKDNHAYLYWMIREDSGFDAEVKEICKRLLFHKGNHNPVLQKARENKIK